MNYSLKKYDRYQKKFKDDIFMDGVMYALFIIYNRYIIYRLFFFLFIYFITSFFEELFMLRKIIIIKKNYVRIKIHVSSRFPRPCSKSRDPAITLKKKDKGVCGCRIPLLSMNKS